MRGQDSNLRPSAYEADELPLLHPTRRRRYVHGVERSRATPRDTRPTRPTSAKRSRRVPRQRRVLRAGRARRRGRAEATFERRVAEARELMSKREAGDGHHHDEDEREEDQAGRESE